MNFQKIGSQFVHADFEAVAASIRISFSHKATKRTQVGTNGPRVSYKGPSRPQSRLTKHKNKSPQSRQLHDTHQGYHGRNKKKGGIFRPSSRQLGAQVRRSALNKLKGVHHTTKRKFHQALGSLVKMTSSLRYDHLQLDQSEVLYIKNLNHVLRSKITQKSSLQPP